MRRKNHKLFVEDILSAMNKIEHYIKGLTYKKFVKNDMVVDAVIRKLEVIGEASKNIPEDIKKQYPEIPWKRIIGLRNIAVLEYFGIDLSIIWEIITSDLPETKPKVVVMLKGLNEKG